MTWGELQIPDDPDEAALWLRATLDDPATMARLAADKRLAASFIAHATTILGRVARRDGEDALADLLARAHAEAERQADG